jgi:hypothetical protein
LLQYFEAAPGPLSQKPLPYDTSSIAALIKRLRPYNITKGEFIMMVNLRPTSVPILNTVLEDMETRFEPHEQEDIVQGVVEVMGDFPPPPMEEGDEEDAMQTT